jgi:hypothetical protein
VPAGDERAENGPPGIPPTATDLLPGFAPENELERRLIEDPVLLRGLAWGRPRRGHPEGSVAAHVRDLLATIDRWGETGARRAELRFLALVHDSLKFQVSNWILHVGENHHGMRARRFAEAYTSDERLLAILELHDRPFNLWRRRLLARGHLVRDGVDSMIRRLPDMDLFLRFVELDGSTEGKRPEPLAWLKAELSKRASQI